MRPTRFDYFIIIALSCCLTIAFFETDPESKKTKEIPKDENYYDSVQVVNDAVKDSNSSHIPY